MQDFVHQQNHAPICQALKLEGSQVQNLCMAPLFMSRIPQREPQARENAKIRSKAPEGARSLSQRSPVCGSYYPSKWHPYAYMYFYGPRRKLRLTALKPCQHITAAACLNPPAQERALYTETGKPTIVPNRGLYY